MPMYEYQCENEDCEQFNERKERIVKIKNRDLVTCEDCENQMKRIASVTAGPNISWSLWRT